MFEFERRLAVLAERIDEIRERLFQLTRKRVRWVHDKKATPEQAKAVNRRFAHRQ